MDIKAIIHHLKTGDDVDAQLEDFERLDREATKDDLPILLNALRANDAGFWVRELISETVLKLGGVSMLPEVLRALEQNFREGHDNDSLQEVLAAFAEENRPEVMKALDALDPARDGIKPRTLDWLYEFCKADDENA